MRPHASPCIASLLHACTLLYARTPALFFLLQKSSHPIEKLQACAAPCSIAAWHFSRIDPVPAAPLP